MPTDNRNRALHYAILASLALHALLLSAFPGIVDTARRGSSIPQIIARLTQPEAPAPAQRVPEKRPVKPAPKPSIPPRAEIRAEQPEPPVAAPAPPAATVEPNPAPSAAAVDASESISRDQYRVQLIDEARRHKRYPPLAREYNWQGDVLVGVAVGAHGRASVSLKAGSGYEVLDRQALAMFAQAARSVPVPPALRGKEFALDLRAVYGLED